MGLKLQLFFRFIDFFGAFCVSLVVLFVELLSVCTINFMIILDGFGYSLVLELSELNWLNALAPALISISAA